MTTFTSPEAPALITEYSYRNFVDSHFLRLAYAEHLTTLVGGKWVIDGDIDAAPGELLGGASYAVTGQQERLVRVESALCQLILSERALMVRAAAATREEAERAIDTIKLALPEFEPAEREVPARFWWWSTHGATELARTVPFEPWSELEHNYAGITRQRLAELNGWREQPPSGGRLILWHGLPGTGKTSAIRTLAGEWQSWAEFQFVTDPEQLLLNPSYLLEAVTGSSQPTGPHRPPRWKVIVLEDSGEFLLPDAKRATGQALSRLLNVCDGVLGMAMRALVLITTNEPLNDLHPALTRPGRCLSEISFEPFDAHEITEWCARRQHARPIEAHTASLAELYAHLEGRSRKPKHRALGFAPAAA